VSSTLPYPWYGCSKTPVAPFCFALALLLLRERGFNSQFLNSWTSFTRACFACAHASRAKTLVD
jgi:hypothetical protein